MNQISARASNQLEAWEAIAREWILVPDYRIDQLSRLRLLPGQLHLICPECNVSVFSLSEQSISPSILLASTVAHLRNLHRELDPDA